MDGTLADFDGAMRRDMEALHSPHEPPLNHDHRDESIPYLEARRTLIKRQPGWWLKLARLEVGFKVLNELNSLQFETHVLTKGPWNTTNAWTEKVEWCRREIPKVPVTVTDNKALVYGRVLVDDWPSYVLAWLAVRPRGLVVMPAQPWNVDTSHPRILRYTGADAEWQELRSRLVDQAQRP